MKFNRVECIAAMIMYYISVSSQSLAMKLVDRSTNLFQLSLIHINDVHARFDETNHLGLACKSEQNASCIGGYARMVAVIRMLQNSQLNPIYLNAGDNFVGTIWYTFGRQNLTSYLLNLHKADVMTLGNHEFDDGQSELIPFLDDIQSPIVLANIDLTEAPRLQRKFSNSTILIRGGRKIGVIGIIVSDISSFARAGKIRFLDETDTVREEANRLKADGVDIIVVLSHCGIQIDLKIAQNVGSNVDIIVGGHSHTFMYSGTPPVQWPDKPLFEYPAVVEHDNGHKVLVVQASAYAKYVGNIILYFDESGEIIRWAGQPIYLASDVQPDEFISKQLLPWKRKFEEESRQVIGATDIFLDYSRCKFAECAMGNVMADAYMRAYRNQTNDTQPAIAFIQAGAIRQSIQRGSITYGDVYTVAPYSNAVLSFDLLGKYIWDAMERSMELIDLNNTTENYLLQISGMRLGVNVKKPIGHRLQSIQIVCTRMNTTTDRPWAEYESLNLNSTYRVVSNDYLTSGDSDALISYFQSMPVLKHLASNRIIIST